ncbi:hypothetical protein U1Q18_014906, partial [Sarracenia purpurea var. burkii]
FCISQFVHLADSEPSMYPSSDISWESLSGSATHVHLDASAIPFPECIQPCPPPIEQAFPAIRPIAEEPVHIGFPSFSYGAATPILQVPPADVPIPHADDAESHDLDTILAIQPEEDIPSADILREILNRVISQEQTSAQCELHIQSLHHVITSIQKEVHTLSSGLIVIVEAISSLTQSLHDIGDDPSSSSDKDI